MRIGVITDVHLAPAGHPPVVWHNPLALDDALERFRQALDLCVDAGVEGIAILGDLTHLGDTALLDAGVNSAVATGLPIWIVPGNHDVLVQEDALSRAVAAVGESRMRVANPGGDVADNVRIAGVGLIRRGPSDQLRSTLPDLPAWGDDPVVLLSHFPLLSLQERAMAAGLKYAGDLENVAEGAPLLLRRTAPTVILHGHLHIGHAEARGTVLQIGCAALVEPPYAVNVLNVRWSGDDLVVEHQEVPVAPSPDITLPRLSPPSQRWVFNAGTWRSSGVPGA